MRTRTAAALLAAGLLALTGCGNDSNTASKESSSPPAAASDAPTEQYDVHDCRALLERNYDANNVYDASSDLECSDLTESEYREVVGDVLTGRKDEIIEDATNEMAWDAAWKATDKKQQAVVCDRLSTDGSVIVGQEMMDAADDPTGDEIDMVQYFHDKKC